MEGGRGIERKRKRKERGRREGKKNKLCCSWQNIGCFFNNPLLFFTSNLQ